MKEKSNALLVFGIINAVSVFIADSLAGVFSWIIMIFSNGNDVVINVGGGLSALIVLLSPLSCILGIVLGIILFRKKDYAKACIILSIVGLLLFVVATICMVYIALRF